MIHRQGLSSRLFGLVAEPLRRNTSFFVFMYVLGVVVSVVELPDKPDAKLYDNLWPELLLDLYVVCAMLALLPQRLRRWVRGVVCATAYVVAIADVFCFWKFGSALTPTMLLLVGETNGNEASEFLSTYINASVILSPVGWLLLIAVLQLATALLLPRLRKRKVGGLDPACRDDETGAPLAGGPPAGTDRREYHHIVAQQARDGGHVLAAEHRRYRA